MIQHFKNSLLKFLKSKSYWVVRKESRTIISLFSLLNSVLALALAHILTLALDLTQFYWWVVAQSWKANDLEGESNWEISPECLSEGLPQGACGSRVHQWPGGNKDKMVKLMMWTGWRNRDYNLLGSRKRMVFWLDLHKPLGCAAWFGCHQPEVWNIGT